MAKDLYESRQMYQSPLMLIIILPIIGVLLILGIEFGFKFYNVNKIETVTKEVLTKMLERESLTTIDKKREFCKQEFKDRGYKNIKHMVLIEVDDYYVLVMYHNYFSIVNTLLFQPAKTAVARYKGYYNEYNEPVLERLDSDEDEDQLLEQLDTNDEESIKIN